MCKEFDKEEDKEEGRASSSDNSHVMDFSFIHYIEVVVSLPWTFYYI